MGRLRAHGRGVSCRVVCCVSTRLSAQRASAVIRASGAATESKSEAVAVVVAYVQSGKVQRTMQGKRRDRWELPVVVSRLLFWFLRIGEGASRIGVRSRTRRRHPCI